MAIKRRDFSAIATLQVPTSMPPREFVPNPKAFLEKFPAELRRRAGVVIYSETPSKEIPLEDLAYMLRHTVDPNPPAYEIVYRNRIRSRNTAIRAYCVLCAGGPKAARACVDTDCALWPFRFGQNPFARRK